MICQQRATPSPTPMRANESGGERRGETNEAAAILKRVRSHRLFNEALAEEY